MGEIIQFYKKIIRKLSNWFSDEAAELRRLGRIPRYIPGITKIFRFDFRYVDSLSFVGQYNEIFIKHNYQFKPAGTRPFIIDCGANIGVSVLYFKKLYPDAEIIAFEPDKNIFPVLSSNIAASQNATHITLVNKGVWNKESAVNFFSEGADGGAILHPGNDSPSNNDQMQEIQTVSLKNYLNRKVDFLKIDIEGAECTVIEDCGSYLQNAECIFIEYHSASAKDQQLDIILKVLKENNFRYYIESGTITNNTPFISRRVVSGYDNFLCVYAYKKPA